MWDSFPKAPAVGSGPPPGVLPPRGGGQPRKAPARAYHSNRGLRVHAWTRLPFVPAALRWALEARARAPGGAAGSAMGNAVRRPGRACAAAARLLPTRRPARAGGGPREGGASAGGAGPAQGRGQQCGLRFPRWRSERAVRRVGGGAGSGWSRLAGVRAARGSLLGLSRCWSPDALPSRNREAGRNGCPSAQPTGRVGCDFPIRACGAAIPSPRSPTVSGAPPMASMASSCVTR